MVNIFVASFTVIRYPCCSDFLNESNGKFVLGDFLTSAFWRNFFKSCKRCLELKFEKIFHLGSCFVTCDHFGKFGTINARFILRYERVSGDLIRLRNRSKWVEGSLFAITDLLLEAKSIISLFMACRGDDFHKKKLKTQIIFIFFHVITAR